MFQVVNLAFLMGLRRTLQNDPVKTSWGLLVALLFCLNGCGPFRDSVRRPTSEAEHAPQTEFGEKERVWGEPRLLADLENREITESSGLATSRLTRGAFFTHNDSGYPARIYLFDRDGADLGAFDVEGARNVDWEDMASAVVDGEPFLFIGDIGDNRERRTSIQIFRVPEPRPGARARVDEAYEVTYPDGAHDAECLLVHPVSGEVTIVTKGFRGAGIYVFRPDGTGEYPLRKVGELHLGGAIPALVTGGDWSPDGRYVVIRTYFGAYEYAAERGDWFLQPPVPITLFVEPQGEAIAYTLDGNALVTTSEGSPPPLSIVPLAGR